MTFSFPYSTKEASPGRIQASRTRATKGAVVWGTRPGCAAACPPARSSVLELFSCRCRPTLVLRRGFLASERHFPVDGVEILRSPGAHLGDSACGGVSSYSLLASCIGPYCSKAAERESTQQLKRTGFDGFIEREFKRCTSVFSRGHRALQPYVKG